MNGHNYGFFCHVLKSQVRKKYLYDFLCEKRQLYNTVLLVKLPDEVLDSRTNCDGEIDKFFNVSLHSAAQIVRLLKNVFKIVI